MGQCLKRAYFSVGYLQCDKCHTYQKKLHAFYHQGTVYCEQCVPDMYFEKDKVPLMANGAVSGRYAMY